MLLVDTDQTLSLVVGSASVGAVTVTVTRGDGTEVVAAAATTDNGDGTYSYVLDAASNTRLDQLKAVWTTPDETYVTYPEVVGNHLFTITDARSKTTTGAQTPLASSSTYPDADIEAVRQEITEWFEDVTDRSWIRRYCRGVAAGTGHRIISLNDFRFRTADGEPLLRPRATFGVASLVSVTVSGVAVDVDDIEVDGHRLYHKGGSWTSGSLSDPLNVAVEWEYGHRPTPREARDNGLRLALKQLIPSDVPSYAQTFSGGDASISYPQGGYVLPAQVHQWIKRHKPVIVL